MNKEMLRIKILFYYLFLQLTHSQLQINLYLTEWVNNDEKNNDLQHDCLRVLTPIYGSPSFGQIIYYCMGEWPSKWNIEENKFDPKFTFAELSKQNVTSQQLYFWSAPMDIIENYQSYLNQLPNSENTSIAKEIFYNCTLPYFGSKCQYTLNNYKSYYTSLYDMVHDYYCWNRYEPTTFTCYTHLKCIRGPSPSCLDWTEICDGKVDCLDGRYDEEHCWELEIHECNEDEYRCLNGQCIPQIYVGEEYYPYDCLDRSDETSFGKAYEGDAKTSCPISEPTISSEDVSCIRSYNIYTDIFPNSCIPTRYYLLFQAMFSVKPKSISDECWTAFKCIIGVPIPADSFCKNLCFNGICDEIVKRTCADIIYASDVPILLGHVFLAYQNNNLKYGFYEITKSMYVCYNNQLLYLSDDSETQLLSNNNNNTCRLYTSLVPHSNVSNEPEWIGESIDKLYSRLQTSTSWIYNDSIKCNKSTMYQCINSNKCISKHRLFDTLQDCFDYDDENILLWDKNCSSVKQNSKLFKCKKTNECIPFRFVRDGICHCTIYDDYICDDERLNYYSDKTVIRFSKICDNFTHLYPIMIDGQLHTDETECDQWPCNNMYTRCDGFWNCLNGVDELNCDALPLFNCSLNNHICVSFETKKPMCLPIEKANDGIVDCIGAVDEPTRCRLDNYTDVTLSFYCTNSSFPRCINVTSICDTISHCINEDDEKSCTSDDYNRYQQNGVFCGINYESVGSDIEKALCQTFHSNLVRYTKKYFELDEIQSLSKVNVAHPNNDIFPRQYSIKSYQQRCHRGFEIQVWLNKEKNLATSVCLCPPSFYGDICQFQNQRVSFTMGFRTPSDSLQKSFIIIISLIDNSEERIIHSYERFSILSKRYCLQKVHGYLLYSTRPKNQTKLYSIHIDIYEKTSLNYRGSVIKSILFPFLPVHRLSFLLNIPPDIDDMTCSDHQCINGKCKRYFKDPNNMTFCQCNPGWSGRHCTIQRNCTCSSDSLCIGTLANNRSICVCPENKMGDRCLLNPTLLCRVDPHKKCLNGGQFMFIDAYRTCNEFTCICPKGYDGTFCELVQIKIVISFDKNIILPSSIHIHFITMHLNSLPFRETTLKTISLGQTSTTLYWSYQFHIMFIELTSNNYYLAYVYKEDRPLNLIEKTVYPSNHCLHINEIFNKTIINYHRIRRIKYYHIPCQTNTLPRLSCFYDDIYFCLCEDFDHQRLTYCTEFEHNMTMNCSGISVCQNGGECFVDTASCPQKAFCLCPVCFHGTRCQISTDGFSLSLDNILGYHIGPNINLSNQSTAVLLSLVLSIIIILLGIINGVLILITFKNKKIRDVGCGIYLFYSSINTLLTMIIFTLKICILILSHMGSIKNRTFINIQCYSIDFLLQCGLTIDRWLMACIAIERAFIIIKGVNFNKKKSRLIAKLVIISLVLLILGTNIQDPINRSLIDEIDEDEENKRIWCVVNYSSTIRIINLVITIFHIIIPFIINLISAIIIIIKSTRQRALIQKQEKYEKIMKEQFEQHKNLLIGPIILIILAIPRLIIAFASGCMKSTTHSWLFLLGYFISLIPSLLTFILFVVPSSAYYQVFKKAISKYRNILRMRS